jgi:hypothetical protein
MKFELRSSASGNQLHLSNIEKVSLDNFDEGILQREGLGVIGSWSVFGTISAIELL